MARAPELPLTFHTLFHSALLAVRDYHCRACRGGPAAEEYSGSDDVVLLRRGAFCKHFGRRSVTADVNQAVFFSKGSTYRVSHPADDGDRGTVFTPSPRLLHDLRGELAPGREDGPFPVVTAACPPAVFWRHRELVRRLENGAESPEPLWVEETALQVLADVLGAACAGLDRPRRRRQGTEAAHADRVEGAKSYLAARLGERTALDDLAAAVHTSPFHLARVFRQRTGVPVHRYLTRLRLRAALDRLLSGAANLTALALELGFSSHSHFTTAFRREFGRPPSDVRRSAATRTGRRALGEMSKDLQA
jgi:AraC family transcriptional regulator